MKSFAKICLIIAAAAAALGLVGIGAGMAMGASPDEFLDIARNESHVVLKPGQAGKEEVNAGEGNITSEGLAFGNADTCSFELELKKGDVDIYVYDGEQILFTGTDLPEISRRLNFEVEDETVSVEDDTKARHEPLALEIYLPRRMFQYMDLDLGAADVYIESLEAEEIIIDLGAGNLEADRIAAGSSADLDVGTGAMTIAYLEGANLDLDCGIGALELVLQGSEGDYTYTLDCGVGSIELGENSYSGLGRETQIDGSSGTGVSKYVNVDCGIGEISIEFEEE